MPWERRTVKEAREEFVEQATKPGANISELCRTYEISRKTGYKWLHRAQAGEGSEDRSRKPIRSPGRTCEQVERAVLEARAKFPAWGPLKLRIQLERSGIAAPSERTISNILKRNQCIDPEEARKHLARVRFERENCNELWQADFKGDFTLGDGKRCYPLDILDDHSRYCIRIEPKLNTRNVMDDFRAAFEEYGLPEAILCDNGGSFRGINGGFTVFERNLMDLDILPIHSRPYHPQTQGKIERFHRTMKAELLSQRTFANQEEVSEALAAWRIHYNCERPHQALGMRCPTEVFTPSKRTYPAVIPKWEACEMYPRIKVNNWGYLRFSSMKLYLSETFNDTVLEIRQHPKMETLIVCYRNFVVAHIDPERKELSRKLYRL